PLAVAALYTAGLALAALMALWVQKVPPPATADKVARAAQTNPSPEIPSHAVDLLDRWRYSTDPATAEKAGRLVAEVYGTTGTFVRWRYRKVPQDQLDAVRQQLGTPASLKPFPAWTDIGTVGLDHRVQIGFIGKGDVYLAYADV